MLLTARLMTGYCKSISNLAGEGYKLLSSRIVYHEGQLKHAPYDLVKTWDLERHHKSGLDGLLHREQFIAANRAALERVTEELSLPPIDPLYFSQITAINTPRNASSAAIASFVECNRSGLFMLDAGPKRRAKLAAAICKLFATSRIGIVVKTKSEEKYVKHQLAASKLSSELKEKAGEIDELPPRIVVGRWKEFVKEDEDPFTLDLVLVLDSTALTDDRTAFKLLGLDACQFRLFAIAGRKDLASTWLRHRIGAAVGNSILQLPLYKKQNWTFEGETFTHPNWVTREPDAFGLKRSLIWNNKSRNQKCVSWAKRQLDAKNKAVRMVILVTENELHRDSLRNYIKPAWTELKAFAFNDAELVQLITTEQQLPTVTVIWCGSGPAIPKTLLAWLMKLNRSGDKLIDIADSYKNCKLLRDWNRSRLSQVDTVRNERRIDLLAGAKIVKPDGGQLKLGSVSKQIKSGKSYPERIIANYGISPGYEFHLQHETGKSLEAARKFNDEERQQALYDANYLYKAWLDCSRKGKSPGPDGIRYRDLSRSEVWEVLRALVYDLNSGIYKPGPVKVTRFPKPNGGERKIVLENIVDRVVSAGLGNLIGPQVDKQFLDCSWGWRWKQDEGSQGRKLADCVKSAVAAIQGQECWIALLDVKDAFPTTPARFAYESLKLLQPDDAYDRVLQSLLGLDKPDSKLRQGNSLSPLLFNSAMHRLIDTELVQLGVTYYRYADNLFLASSSSSTLQQAVTVVENQLQSQGMRLGDKQFYNPGWEAFTFLGAGFRNDRGVGTYIPLSAFNDLDENLKNCHMRPADSSAPVSILQGFVKYWSQMLDSWPEDDTNRVVQIALGAGTNLRATVVNDIFRNWTNLVVPAI